MATVVELRKEAASLGIAGVSRMSKDDLEAAITAKMSGTASQPADESDTLNLADENGDDAAEDEESDDETEDVEDEPGSPMTPHQLSEATLASFQDENGNFDPEAYAAATPRRREYPPNINKLGFAELELSIRTHSYRKEVRINNQMVSKNFYYELPPDHTLDGPGLQDLLVALRTSAEEGLPYPDWQEFE